MALKLAPGLGVRLEGAQPPLSIGLTIMEGVFRSFGYDCIITSITDGTHSKGSLHYVGKAVDLRINHLIEADIRLLITRLKDSLGDEFDVVLESNHIHVEYDPD